MNHAPAPTPGDAWETRLLRHLTEVSELMVRSSDMDQVLTRMVHECTSLLEVDGAGLMLADGTQGLRKVAVSEPRWEPGTDVQRRSGRGPTHEAVRTGRALDIRIETSRERWSEWAGTMAGLGIRRVTCLPLRLVDRTLGSLELYSARDQPLLPPATQVGRVLAGLAVVVVHYDTELRSSTRTAEQLSGALQRRVAVEQAKGFLCASGFPDRDAAFAALRSYSRRTRRSLDAVSRDVVDGGLDPSVLMSASDRGR